MNNKYGIELELAGNHHTISGLIKALDDIGWKVEGEEGWSRNTETENMETWFVKTDGSLSASNGRTCEVNSPCLIGEEGLDRFLSMVNELSRLGCDVNDTCGLHIHREATDLTDREFGLLYENYYRMERMMDLCLDPHRGFKHANEYCLPLKRFREDQLRPFQVKSLLMDESKVPRHSTLGFSSYAIRGTVEYRHAQASLDEAFLHHWWTLVDRIFSSKEVIEVDASGRAHCPEKLITLLGLPADATSFFSEIYNSRLSLEGIDYFSSPTRRDRQNTSDGVGSVLILDDYTQVEFDDDGLPEGSYEYPGDPCLFHAEKPVEEDVEGKIPDEYLWPS